jgi:hypothetical protein
MTTTNDENKPLSSSSPLSIVDLNNDLNSSMGAARRLRRLRRRLFLEAVASPFRPSPLGEDGNNKQSSLRSMVSSSSTDSMSYDDEE